MSRIPDDDHHGMQSLLALDDEPSSEEAARAHEASRLAALTALRAAPVVRPWRREALRMTLIGLGVTAVGAAFTARVGGMSRGLGGSRLPAIAVLVVGQALALWAAIRPGRITGRPWGWLGVPAWSAAAGGAALLLSARTAFGAPLSSESAGWVCSASHLAVALVPATIMLTSMRHIAWSWWRAVTAGLAVGISGLVWGEIACERSVSHVLVHHFGALAVMVLACVLISRRLSRGAYAP